MAAIAPQVPDVERGLRLFLSRVARREPGASAARLQEAEEGRGGWKLPGHFDGLGRGANKRPRSKLRGMDLQRFKFRWAVVLRPKESRTFVLLPRRWVDGNSLYANDKNGLLAAELVGMT